MQFEVLTWRTFLYGVLVWLVPFIGAMPIVSLKEKRPLVFKAIVGTILTVGAVALAHAYFLSASAATGADGLIIGAVWAAVCIAIDLPLFTLAFKMRPAAYLTEIGIAYLVLPAIACAQAAR